jgi:hypothetical protein
MIAIFLSNGDAIDASRWESRLEMVSSVGKKKK